MLRNRFSIQFILYLQLWWNRKNIECSQVRSDLLLLSQTIYKNEITNCFYNNKKEKKKVVSKKSELVKILQYSPSLPFFCWKIGKSSFLKTNHVKYVVKKLVKFSSPIFLLFSSSFLFPESVERGIVTKKVFGAECHLFPHVKWFQIPNTVFTCALFWRALFRFN